MMKSLSAVNWIKENRLFGLSGGDLFERVSMCADVLAPTSLSSAPTTWRHDLAQGHSSFSLTSTPAASAATSVEYRITANLNDSRDYRFAGVNGTKRNRIFGTSERDKRHW